MSEKIILIETSTESCSAALSDGELILASRANSAPKVHASMLAPYVAQCLDEAGLSMSDCDAVAVSEGPGSYTGLRVGVSTAKGLCFGSGKPLIAVDTLQILALQAEGTFDRIIAMLDARRMEVYCAQFATDGTKLTETSAVILDQDSFKQELEQGSVLFIGTGVEKFRAICNHPNAHFQNCFPLAANMVKPALASYKEKEFKDVAYFEPFYLKEFVAGISKKSVL